jgi:nitrous-oxide reductase
MWRSREYAEKFKGTISFVSVEPASGAMAVAFQILVPGFNYDLAASGKGPSHGWTFFTCYNSEKANSLLEVNASRNDKDYIAAVNWKKAEEYVAQGARRRRCPACMCATTWTGTRFATSETRNTVKVLDPADCPDMIYYLPTPKSPHGVDVDPTGEYIAAGGKLAAVIPVHSFTKMLAAIEARAFDGDEEGIPVLKYDAVLQGEVKDPGLGPLHTEFDGRGFAYTSSFISSEIVKWEVATQTVVDRIPTYYSIGHLCVPGGDTMKPWGKYVIALNKITKDRYLPTGPELAQSAQLIDITGQKMTLLLDFPTIGEPHYAQAIPAEVLAERQVKFFRIEDNTHPGVTKSEKDARVSASAARCMST